MAVLRTVHVGNQDIPMRASARIPRLYRVKFGRDIIRDINRLKKSMEAVKKDPEAELDVMDLTIFEDMAWLFAKHADPDVPADPDDWLDSIDGVFSIYEAFPAILDLWAENAAQTSVPAKK